MNQWNDLLRAVYQRAYAPNTGSFDDMRVAYQGTASDNAAANALFGTPQQQAQYNYYKTIQDGLDVLAKYGSDAHLWLPGIGYMSGINYQNYLDSAGITLASVDNPVGLVLDAANALGSELAPATIDFTGAAWTKGGGATVPSAKLVNFPAEGAEIFQFNTGVNSASKSYLIQFTATGNGTLSIGVTNTIDFAPRVQLTLTGTPQTFTCKVDQNSTTTSAAGLSFCRQAGDTCTQANITAASWKQISGIPATQATTANKPTLTRGLVNGLTNSNLFTSGTYLGESTRSVVGPGAPNGGSYGRLTPNTTGGTLGPAAGTANRMFSELGASYGSGPWTFAAYIKKDALAANVALYVEDYQSDTVRATTLTAVTDSWQLVTVSGATATSGVRGCISVDQSILVGGFAIFQGIFTAQQIQQCGGIPLTTTNPASSALGNFGWQFQASNSQYLGMSGPIINPNSDHFLAFAAVPGPGTGGFQSVFGQAASSTGESLPEIGISSTGQVTFVMGGGGTTIGMVSTPAYLGQPIVGDAAVVSSSVTLSVNNAVVVTNTLSGTYTTPTNASIGSLGRSTRADYCNSQIGAVMAIQGTVPPADRVTLRRMLAAFAGPTGVTF
jgi:hypothetical protein